MQDEKSLFNEKQTETLKKVRKIFLKVAVWILIAEFALGAVLILAGAYDATIGRIQGTFLILATILFIGVNNFIRMEKGNKIIQCLALTSFIGNLIWGILAVLIMWEVIPALWPESATITSSYGRTFNTTVYHMSVPLIIMLIATYTALASFLISNILVIKENIKSVKPLKITSIVCIVYLWIFGTIITIIQPSEYDEVLGRFALLFGLAYLAAWVTAIAALIISRVSRNKSEKTEISPSQNRVTQDPNTQASTPLVPQTKTDAELRAEIEEQVRREMIEKEVRAKMDAEAEDISG